MQPIGVFLDTVLLFLGQFPKSYWRKNILPYAVPYSVQLFLSSTTKSHSSVVELWTAIPETKVQIPALPPTFFPRQAFFTHPLNYWKMSSKLLSILLLLFVPFPMHGIVQYDYKVFFLPYNFGHLYTWTFTISKIVTQASLVEISDKTFAVGKCKFFQTNVIIGCP